MMSIVLSPIRYLNDLKDNGDPRTKQYGVLLSPALVFPLIISYLYFVKIAGPRWMKKREAFQIPNIVRVYNCGMVLLNARFLYLLLKFTYLPGGRYSLWCQGITGKMDSEMAVLYKAGWWYLLVRYADFLDTIFFVLRKKFNQVSNLHVIHHTLVVFNAWFWVLVAPEGQPALGLCINTFVHVIMYTYYFLSTFGPEVRKYLWWKRYLTTLQIWQFVVFIIHMCIPLFVDCGFPKKLVPFAVAQAFLVLGMFLNFYYHAYIKPTQTPAQKAAALKRAANGDSHICKEE